MSMIIKLSQQVWMWKDQQLRQYRIVESNIYIYYTKPCDRDLEDSKADDIMAHHDCVTIPSLVTKCQAIQKIFSRQITEILNHHFDLDLEPHNPTFS